MGNELTSREQRAIDLSHVQVAPPSGGAALPCTMAPVRSGVDLPAWIGAHRIAIDELLVQHGALLFRGFPVGDAGAFEKVVLAFGMTPMPYEAGTSPRSVVHGVVSTSTEFAAHMKLPIHQEQAYMPRWPRRLWFFCEVPPRSGGQTPIASCRRITRRIPEDIREAFRTRRVMYTRTLYDENEDSTVELRGHKNRLSIAWQRAFDTPDRAVVDEKCARLGLKTEWLDRGRVYITNVLDPFVAHPVTGELVWFNQIHAATFNDWGQFDFGEWAKTAALTEEEVRQCRAHILYGDGGTVAPETIERLRAVFLEEEVTFFWQEGDVLMLDNVLAGHGRNPFAGPRRILVSLAI